MAKNIVRWLMNIVFYVIYFLIFDFTVGNLFPISPIENSIIVFILVIVNIPLAVMTTEKVFSMIEKNDRD